jgi:hypothetical protein
MGWSRMVPMRMDHRTQMDGSPPGLFFNFFEHIDYSRGITLELQTGGSRNRQSRQACGELSNGSKIACGLSLP